MFGQPRCREWTPLATQQLRLRSLLQIVGYNLYGNDGCCEPGSLYYTLHTTTMSAPFYTSEKLLSNHPKWREIDSECIHKMSSLNVVVRVWKHIHHEDKTTTEKASQDLYKQTDKVIQTWGVNFSGLLHIGANLSLDFNSKSFKENTLIFQMTGGYFCSYDKLRAQPVPRGLNHKSNSPSKVIPIDSRYKGIKESKSVSPGIGHWRSEALEGRYVSKSHSPPAGGFRQNTVNEKRALNVHRTHDSYSDSVYEHSPKSETGFEIREYSGSEGSKSSSSLTASNRDLTSVEESETAEHYDANIAAIPKYRYSSMKFLNSEIRPSYNAKKLRMLHLLQFSIGKKLQAVQEIKERIYQKSAMENCENLSPGETRASYEDFSRSENLSVSCREFSFLTGKKHQKQNLFLDNGKMFNKNDEKKTKNETESNTEVIKNESKVNNKQRLNKLVENTSAIDRRFTLPLNKLLEFKMQPSPTQRLKYTCLTKQLELSRFKVRLLKDERNNSLIKIRQLKENRDKQQEENQDFGSELMQKYHSLCKKWDQLKELRKSESALRELWLRSAHLLKTRRWQLVQDIQTIFPITENEKGELFILGIHLPACQGDGDGLRQVSEANLAVALGRVAHVAALAAALLAVPLRHPLKLMGSRTKVRDHLSPQLNEISLFARNKDPMMFRYGLFLLNRNIAQLLWDTHRFITPDPRNTLGNLQKLLHPPQISANLESLKAFGSVSSVETEGNAIYGLFHPFSASGLTTENVTALQHSTSSFNNLTGAMRKTPHSLRSLVAVGTDRSTRSIMSGGFSNTGGRPFNRFKDSVDGHSPKTAMVIRRHRYSRSVGSYLEEQSLQNLELGASTIGSEPSLLIHAPNGDAQFENPSNSPSENVENVMSLSESDLTKVSDITSPGSNDFSANTNHGKVVFSLGDDGGIPKQRSLENSPSDSYIKHDNPSISIENVEINNLKSDVTQLSKELEQLCVNYTSDIIDQVEKFTCNKVVDIEKLDDIIYCSEPCSENCQQAFEAISQAKHSSVLKESDSEEVMHDVIVLPSAEAVMASSSHFTDSLRLDEIDYGDSEITDNTKSGIDEISDQLELPCDCAKSSKGCLKCAKNDSEESSSNCLQSTNCDGNDCDLIYEGSSASRDANALLDNIKQIEETEMIGRVLNTLELSAADVTLAKNDELTKVAGDVR